MISKEEFAEEFAELAYEAGIEDICAIDFPEYMRERNDEDPRSFAEVDPWQLEFYFAPQVLDLPWTHRRGLLMHEIGHVLARDLPNGGTEDDADHAAREVFGETIIYDRRWPGKGLQCVRCGRENPARPAGLTDDRFFHFSDDPEPPSYYDSFSSHFHAGTPYGVYVYPGWAWGTPEIIFGKDRKFIHVLEARGGKVLDLQNVTDEDMDEVSRLIPRTQFERLRRMWDRYQQNFRGSRPGAELWYYITKAWPEDWDAEEVAESVNFAAPVVSDPKHSNRLLRDLDYAAVTDSEGIIWSSEPVQAFFTAPDAFRVVSGARENPRRFREGDRVQIKPLFRPRGKDAPMQGTVVRVRYFPRSGSGGNRGQIRVDWDNGYQGSIEERKLEFAKR